MSDTCMKKPEECNNIGDIRDAIDTIDRNIVDLIGARAEYVQAAAEYKTDTESVKAPQRVREMLGKRRQWAATKSLDTEFIGRIFSLMVDHFVNQELRQWTANDKNKD